MGARFLRMTAALAASLATLSLAQPQAGAAIIAADSTPASVSVGATGPATVTVNWEVLREAVNPPSPATVSSQNIKIRIGGSVVATLARTLTKDIQGQGFQETVKFREVVQLPQAVIYRAIKQGGALRLEREFNDNADNISKTAELEVRPSGEGAAAFAVQRLELAFGDDARSKVLSKGSELHVVAELNTSGTGLLTGQWEVADGSTTAGTPVFRALTLVRQGIGGGGRAVITSPPLPTAMEGTHLVRFRVVEPGFAYETPVLQYYVTAAVPGQTVAQSPAAQQQVLISAPRPGAVLDADTHFAWNAIPGADAYRIAFYATPAGPAEPLDPAQNLQAQAAPELPDGDPAPLAGIFVAGGQTEAVLPPSSLAQLPADRSYLWKVTAIDGNGAVIGSSSIRKIHKP